MLVVEGVAVVMERDRGTIEGGDGGEGEKEGKAGRQKPNRSDVDAEERSKQGGSRGGAIRGFFFPPKQKRPTKRRRPSSFSLSCSLGTDTCKSQQRK